MTNQDRAAKLEVVARAARDILSVLTDSFGTKFVCLVCKTFSDRGDTHEWECEARNLEDSLRALDAWVEVPMKSSASEGSP